MAVHFIELGGVEKREVTDEVQCMICHATLYVWHAAVACSKIIHFTMLSALLIASNCRKQVSDEVGRRQVLLIINRRIFSAIR